MTQGLSKYLNYIIEKVCTDQDLCKLLYYNEDDPLSSSDISDTTILYTDKNNQRLFYTPFSVDVDDVQKTTLTVILDEVSLDKNSLYFKRINIDFIIACNNYLWSINDSSGEIKTRPLEIWAKLDELFNRQQTSGLGKDIFNYGKLIYFNQYFSGYKICYKGLDLPIIGE